MELIIKEGAKGIERKNSTQENTMTINTEKNKNEGDLNYGRTINN